MQLALEDVGVLPFPIYLRRTDSAFWALEPDSKDWISQARKIFGTDPNFSLFKVESLRHVEIIAAAMGACRGSLSGDLEVLPITSEELEFIKCTIKQADDSEDIDCFAARKQHHNATTELSKLVELLKLPRIRRRQVHRITTGKMKAIERKLGPTGCSSYKSRKPNATYPANCEPCKGPESLTAPNGS